MRERDLKVINTSDADIVAAFARRRAPQSSPGNRNERGVVGTECSAGVRFQQDTGEILDLMVVKTDVLNAQSKLGKALIGAWYETLALMFKMMPPARRPRRRWPKRLERISPVSARQLATTHLFTTPADAYAFVTAAGVIKSNGFGTQVFIRARDSGAGCEFHGRRRHSISSREESGDPHNLKMRFDSAFSKLAMDGKLEFSLIHAPAHQPATGTGGRAHVECAALHSRGRRVPLLLQRAPGGESGRQIVAWRRRPLPRPSIDSRSRQNERSGEYLLWNDTAPVSTLLTALAISALIGVTLGVAIGVLPICGHALGHPLSRVSRYLHGRFSSLSHVRPDEHGLHR